MAELHKSKYFFTASLLLLWHPTLLFQALCLFQRKREILCSVRGSASSGRLPAEFLTCHSNLPALLLLHFWFVFGLSPLRQCRAVLSDRHIWSGSKAIWVSRCALQASGHWHGGGLCSPGFSHMDSWLSLHTPELTNRPITRRFTVVTHGLSHKIIHSSSTPTKPCVMWFIISKLKKITSIMRLVCVNMNPDFSCFSPFFSPSRSGDVGRLIWSRRQRCPAEPTDLLAQSDGRDQESYCGMGFSILFSRGYSINTAFCNNKKVFIGK